MQEADCSVVVYSECQLVVWEHLSNCVSQELVIPDGCRDVIVKTCDEQPSRCFLSELSRTAYCVPMEEGIHLIGIRLKPGTVIHEQSLQEYIDRHGIQSMLTGGRLDDFCERAVDVAESLDCLGSGVRSVAEAASQLGISTRTLQRTVKGGTATSPQFWLALSRVRRTCRNLHRFERLVEAVDEFGYADQSHMAREVGCWFGVRPSSITPESAVYSRLCDDGFY